MSKKNSWRKKIQKKKNSKKFYDTFFWLGPKGPTVGPEGPHRCSRRLQPSAGARKKPPVGGLNFLVFIKFKNSFISITYSGILEPDQRRLTWPLLALRTSSKKPQGGTRHHSNNRGIIHHASRIPRWPCGYKDSVCLFSQGRPRKLLDTIQTSGAKLTYRIGRGLVIGLNPFWWLQNKIAQIHSCNCWGVTIFALLCLSLSV